MSCAVKWSAASKLTRMETTARGGSISIKTDGHGNTCFAVMTGTIQKRKKKKRE